MRRRIIKLSLKIAVSAGFVAWLIWSVDWSEVVFYVKNIQPLYIIAYFAILFIGMLVSAIKWRSLARHKGINLPLWEFFKLYLGGTFVNNFFPSFIGGDAFRAYQIGKESRRFHEAFSTVVADRMTGLLGAMVLTAAFFVLNISRVMPLPVLTVLNIGVIIGLVVFAGLVLTRSLPVWNYLNKKLPRSVGQFMGEVADFLRAPRVFAQALFWSLVFNLIGLGVVNYVLFRGLGIEVGAMDYLSVIFLISIIASAPVSINNIGIKEWAYITFFGFFGVSAGAVATVAIVSRFLQMAVSFLALPVYLKSRKD